MGMADAELGLQVLAERMLNVRHHTVFGPAGNNVFAVESFAGDGCSLGCLVGHLGAGFFAALTVRGVRVGKFRIGPDTI